jgi:hypothetical protein
MNVKRYILSSLAVFVTTIVLDIVTHRVILAPAYEATRSVWRPDSAIIPAWTIVPVALTIAFVFTYMFVKGCSKSRGIGDGLRFGGISGVFISLPISYMLYAMLPIPFSLALQWLVYGLIQTILMGITASSIYRPITFDRK